MTTVSCVYVQGEYPYTTEYVTRLHAMVARWMDRPFKFCCLTDQPWLFQPPIETVLVPKLVGFAPWTKLQLFNPARDWTDRVLYLDLDVLIVKPLAELLDTKGRFLITEDPPRRQRPRTRDGYGRRIIRRFNSSVMVWDGGTQTDLYTDWTPRISKEFSGDQDWIAEQHPTAHTWPRDWFPRISECGAGIPDEARIVLVKVPKNHLAVERYPWVAPLWGAA